MIFCEQLRVARDLNFDSTTNADYAAALTRFLRRNEARDLTMSRN